MKNKAIIFIILLLLISIGANIYFFYLKDQKNINSDATGITMEDTENNILFGKENMNFVINLKDEEDIVEFKNLSSFPEGILFYSIKSNDKDKWDLYWDNAYKNISSASFSEKEFDDYMSESFKKISNNKFELNLSDNYFLDGGIFLSSGSIEEKISSCNMYHKKITTDSNALTDNINNCVDLSYLYEAIKLNDVTICDNILDKNTKHFVRENCIELLK